jgi:hypothetical protein
VVLPPLPSLPPLLPHPTIATEIAVKIISSPNSARFLYLRARRPRNRKQVSNEDTPAELAFPGCPESSNAELPVGVVETVRTAVVGPDPVIVTGLVDPKLNVGGSWAPEGAEAMSAVRTTVPVKPSVGVMVMVEVLPVVAPGRTAMGVAPTVKEGGGRATVYFAETTSLAV